MDQDKSQEEYKQDVLAFLDEDNPILNVKLTLRGFFFILLAHGLASLWLLSLMMKVPSRGLYLYEILRIRIGLFKVRISQEHILMALGAVALVVLLHAIYIVLKAKTTNIKMNTLNMEISKGVFMREMNYTDMVSISDQKVVRSVLDRLLGISKITIFASDKTSPEVTFKGVDSLDSDRMVAFLRKFAFRNYTEYRISKDKQQDLARRKNAKDKKTAYQPIVDEED